MSVIKKLSVLVVAVGLLSQAIAQEAPGGRTIAVTGTAVIHVKPDYASLQVGAFARSSSAVQAKRQCDAAMAKAIVAIRNLGIKPEDIETTEYSVLPMRAKGDPRTTWKVVESASVKVRNLAIVAQVIDVAVAGGAASISDIEFGLDSVGAARDKVRAQAVKAATDKAEALAKLLGVELGDVQSVREEGDYGYRAQYLTNANTAMADGLYDSSAAISAGQQTVSLTVNVVFAIK